MQLVKTISTNKDNTNKRLKISFHNYNTMHTKLCGPFIVSQSNGNMTNA
jgi:hypothetical protein